MSPRRPVRAWLGETLPVDPAELVGPRGLTESVLQESALEGAPDGALEGALDSAADEPALAGDAAFFWSLLTDQRKARIDAVIAARLESVTVVLDRLLDPHNTAAVLRTSEGLGLLRAHVVPHEEGDATAHRRVTQDADKWLDLERHQSGAAAALALTQRGFTVYAGHLDERALLYTALPADRPIALLFGNEHQGPSPETVAACAGTFRIPMAGFTQSFNVSVAAAIALSERTRARRAFLGAAGDLGQDARVLLRGRFAILAAKLARRIKAPRR